MDNSIFMKSYLRPLTNMIKGSLNKERVNDLHSRMQDFLQQNNDIGAEEFKKKLIESFSHEVEIAKFNSIESMMNVIMKNILFFFWVTIASLVISFIALIASIAR